MRQTVVLGLSGGVDSAVAARLLLDQGYQVVGLYLDIGPEGKGAEDAAALARRLSIPFERRDIRPQLEQEVCAPFAAAYRAGHTPLPCAVCNLRVKFPALLAAAHQMGASYVATGHYARRGTGPDGRPLLLRGRSANDQSYMLARLPWEILQYVIFPLGDYKKREVRALAGAEELPVADKPDSMEICFIPEGDYAAWLDSRGQGMPPGDFVDRAGQVLGRHQGIHHYTLGQGRGLGVSGPHRYYVSEIRPETNQVVLSDGSDLWAETVYARDPNWIAVDGLEGPMEVSVRLRHSKTEAPATLLPTEAGVVLQLHTPARAPTPGQLAVFYQGEVVMGSAWIAPSP